MKINVLYVNYYQTLQKEKKAKSGFEFSLNISLNNLKYF